MSLDKVSETLTELGQVSAQLETANMVTAPALAKRAVRLSGLAVRTLAAEMAEMETRLQKLEGNNNG
ncbi:hypothetical protein [Ferrimonas balearica]|uniref:hypothetical protein n=1 Tax=Ferrimonas balearica TaxID=44012 RepID=UPI001F4270D3|nr:hypothetical protein [Ferrimonas balearica]MBY6095134.1 hypothetical protein [Ferrimonas balearica]